MNERPEEPLLEPADEHIDPVIVDDPAPAAPARRSGAGVLALLLALLALLAAGYAGWRVLLLERGDDYASAELQQRLDGLEARLAEAERRSARSNELATTLREQLSHTERLSERLREGQLVQDERSARMEALLETLSSERGDAGEQMALRDAGLLVAQAQARLELFGDRAGANAALSLAGRALAAAGSAHADLRSAIDAAAADMEADGRPSTSALLAELDRVAATAEQAPLRVERPPGTATTRALPSGWWQRQFARVDHLVTVRRADEDDPVATPTKHAVERALDRARLAVLENDHAALPDALRSARASLLACCQADAVADTAARLEALAAIDWQAPAPDLGGLRERLEQRARIGQRPPPLIERAPEPIPDDTRQAPEEHEAAA